MNRLFILFCLLNSFSQKGFGNFEIDFTSTPECANSRNGQIHINLTIDQTSPLPGLLPFPLPYEVAYEETTTGDYGESIMNNVHHTIYFIKAGHYKVTIYFDNRCYSEGEVDVLEIPNPVSVDIVKVNKTCNALGSIHLDPIGGQIPYSYKWSNQSTQKDQQNLIEGEYCFSVTDDNGCLVEQCEFISNSECVNVIFDYSVTYPLPNNKGSISNLGNQSIGAQYIFIWEGPNNFLSEGENIENLEPGTYCLRVICCEQLIFSECFEVEYFNCLNPVIEYLIGHDPLGKGSLTNLHPFNSQYSYSWKGPNNFQSSSMNISNLEFGNYCVEVKCQNKILFSKCYYIAEICEPNPNYILDPIPTVTMCGDFVEIYVNIWQYLEGDYLVYYKLPGENPWVFSNSNVMQVTTTGKHTLRVARKDHPDCYDETEFEVINQRDHSFVNGTVQVFKESNCPTFSYGWVKLSATRSDNGIVKASIINKHGHEVSSFNLNSGELYNEFLEPGTYSIKYSTQDICKPSKIIGFTIKDEGNDPYISISTNASNCISKGIATIKSEFPAKFKVKLFRMEKILPETNFNSQGLSEHDVIPNAQTYIYLDPGNYCVIDNLCNRKSYFNIYHEFLPILQKITIEGDNMYTFNPEGKITISNLPSNCKNGKFLIVPINTKIPNCEYIGINGKPITGNNIYLENLLGDQIYTLYLYCGECCYTKGVKIPFITNDLILMDDCFDQNGYIKIKNSNSACEYKWSTGSTSKQGISISNPGKYCVTITCPSNNEPKVSCIDIPQNPTIIVEDYDPLTLDINNNQDCGGGYLRVSISKNKKFSDPIHYKWFKDQEWWPFSYSNAIYPNMPGKYRVEITTDSNACKLSREFDLKCCQNIPLSSDLYFITNPSSSTSKDGKIEIKNNQLKPYLYSWLGPYNFKSKSPSVYNLPEGEYSVTINSDHCQQTEFKFYLKACQSPFTVETISGAYCSIYENIAITCIITDGHPPYTIYTPVGTFKTNNSAYTFHGVAGNLSGGKKIIVEDNSQCKVSAILYPKLQLSENFTKNLGAEPPICQIDYYCGNQKVGSEDKFELNSYDPDNCILIYKCENEIKQITGTPGSTIIRDGDTNECWEFQFCEFNQNNRKVKRIRGNPTKIEPCYENSKVPPTTFSWEDVKEYWDLILNKWKSDEDGCIYYKEYECTGCPGGKHLERLGASKIKTYCLDQNGVCRETFECGFWSGTALDQWNPLKTYYKDFPVDPSYCANKPKCNVLLTKNPSKIIYNQNENKYYVLGTYDEIASIFLYKYDHNLNLTSDRKYYFNENTDEINKFDHINTYFIDGNIQSVGTTLGPTTINGDISTYLDGTPRIINFNSELSMVNSIIVPFQNWSKIIAQKTSLTGTNYFVLKGAPDLAQTSQPTPGISSAYFIGQYSNQASIQGLKKLDFHENSTNINFCPLASGNLMVASTSESGIKISIQNNYNTILDQTIPNPFNLKIIDIEEYNSNSYILLNGVDGQNNKYTVLLKFAPDLSIVQQKEFHSSQNIQLNKMSFYNNQVILAGHFDGQINLDPSIPDLLNSEYQDILLIVLNQQGETIQYLTGEGSGSEMINDFLVTPSGKAIIMGCYSSAGLSIGDKMFFH